MKAFRTLLLVLLSMVTLICARQSAAQEPQKPAQKPSFRAEVDQVVVYASVYDDKGNLVTELSEEDFEIYEDRVQQQLTSFGRAEVPSTIGIVVDSSGSMKGKQGLVNQAIHLFLELNNPQNELFLIKFDDEVSLEEEFTYEPADIQDSLDNILVRGGTAFYDAISLSIAKAEEGHEPKKVVIVFTDGEDKDSYYTQEEVLEQVRESETQVFVVAFLDEELKEGGFFGIFKSERNKLQNQIRAIAEETGGKAFFPEKIEELEKIFGSIAYELKNQYRLAYISDQSKKDGSWHRIDVRVKDAKKKELKVRAKKGYYSREES